MARLTGLVIACAAGCYAPTPQPGSPCDGGKPCPSGLVCSPASLTCQLDAVDAGPGGGGDASDGSVPGDASPCFGSGLVRLCLDAPPTQPLALAAAMTIDTDSSPLCAPYDGTGLCVIAATVLQLDGVVRGTGKRPLVLVASSDLIVTGTIDVASRRSGTSMLRGAGSEVATCVAGAQPSQKGGGPGGTFGGRGGDGGIGEGGGSAASAPAGVVGAFRAGCAGRAGVGTTPGIGGAGGGAVYLIARQAITVTGTINASGAGGVGAASEGGGGGGGAGGMIGLDAPAVISTGVVFANGGGGGEGGGMASGNAGDNPAQAITAARGGANGAPNGGDGGDGSVGNTTSGKRGGDNTNTAGGGGGGGGAGVIRVFPAQPVGGTVSPPAT